MIDRILEYISSKLFIFLSCTLYRNEEITKELNGLIGTFKNAKLIKLEASHSSGVYDDGELHSVVGPALYLKNMDKHLYYLNGEKLSREEWFEMLTKEQKKEIMFNGERF